MSELLLTGFHSIIVLCKVMYMRNYKGRKTLFVDPTMLKGWQDVFQTEDRDVVEEELRHSGQDFSWSGDNLTIVGREAAVETHPVTGERIWFNQSGVRQPISESKGNTCV